MPTTIQTAVFAIIAVGIYIVLGYLVGPAAGPFDALRRIPNVCTVLGLAFLAFHFFLWRFMPSWLAPTPDLNGTWIAELSPKSARNACLIFAAAEAAYAKP